MITVEEMRRLLLEEFGIRTDEELNKELKRQGGIRIGLFVDPKESQKEKVPATA